ncbi:MAG: hypothetical protein PHV99_01120 [Candidatus Pacebacteria bacterium]|nr:hypothetical protein [Candidatus Paceibacterota bacterium]
MDILTLSFDVLIALLSLWVLVKLTGYGGPIGQALNMVGYGIITIGVSQFIETVGLYFLGDAGMGIVEIVHFFHHLVLLAGMLLVFFGFKKLMNE